MNHYSLDCPRCGSENTASRRQLFHALMGSNTPQGVFSWYGDDEAQALPPKSLFVMFLLSIIVLAIPAAGFWVLGHFPAVTLLMSVALLLLVFLLLDVLLTYRRYKTWGGQWLCGHCRGVFAPNP